MKIGLVALGKNVPSTRFRLTAMLPHLRSCGHDVRMWTSWPSVYEHFPSIGWRLSVLLKKSVRWLQWADAVRFRPDCIYLERGVFHDSSISMDQRFRRATRRLVLDVDDGIFLEFPDKIPQLIRMSDHVVVATPTIAEYVQSYTDQWTLIPTSVHMQRYQARPQTTSQATSQPTSQRRPVIGWIGTAPNLVFLEVVAPALRKLSQELDFELLIVANDDARLKSLDLSGVRVRFQRWQADKEIEHLHQMDIGIMPLPADREWMRYKAATKLVQYLAVGIPAVASPIGVNADILRGNQCGMAAANSDEWFTALRTLVHDSDLRDRLGRCGRELVASQFSIEANAPRLEKVLAS